MTTDKGPNGYAYCQRGLHELTPDNDANGRGRCRACKKWNDQVNYDIKHGLEPRRDPITGAVHPMHPSQKPAAGESAVDAAKRRVAAARAAREKVAAAAAARAAGLTTAPPVSPVSPAMPAVADPPRLADPDPSLPPEPTVLSKPVVVADDGYWSRELAGLPDIDALKKARASGLNAVLYGPPGTGKTQWVETTFVCDLVASGAAERNDGHECSDCAEVLHGDGDTLVDDFIGGWQFGGVEGMYEWIDGPLITAMRLGRPFFIDDFTLIPGKVLAVVYPVMDGRGIIQVKEHAVDRGNGKKGPDIVRAEEGFFVVGGHNPRVHGTLFPEALRSRFTLHIHVPTEYELAREMGIDEDVIKLAENMAILFADGVVGWVPQFRDLKNFMRVKANLGGDAALANLVGLCPEEDQHMLIERIKQVFSGQEVTALKLGGRYDK